MADDQDRGLYGKYHVERRSDPDGKHAGCEYFVLDLHHDKFAADALEAYVRGCVRNFPALACDLNLKAGEVRDRFDYTRPTNGAEINALRNRNAQLERENAALRRMRMKHTRGTCRDDEGAQAVCEGMHDCRIDEVLELCEALGAVRALTGGHDEQSREITRIVDEALEPHQ